VSQVRYCSNSSRPAGQLLGDIRFEGGAGQFITPWMSIAGEQAAVRVSLGNLMSFPFVRAAVAAGQLQVHGWYFDLDHGELYGYNPDTGLFGLLVGGVGGTSGQAMSRAIARGPGE
jgi:hypothetical protein